MKILITGASGRLGSQLLNTLSSDHQIVAVSNNVVPLQENITSFSLDIATDMANLESIFSKEKPEAVIHLAAIIGQACNDDPVLAQQVNVTATAHLAKLAAKYKVKRFIFISTSAVYKQMKLEPVSEDKDIDPVSVYGKTKLEAEHEISRIAQSSKVTGFVTLRVFNIYGPGFDQSLINKLVRSDNEHSVSLVGPDSFYRDYIHINDVIGAIVASISSEFKERHATLNIASGRARSNTELLTELRGRGLSPSYEIIRSSKLDVSWADITRAANLIGLRPTTELVLD